MFQSHSSIIPPGYASTREVSNYMVERLGGKMRKGKRSDVLGLTLFERYDRSGYHVRGYRGNDKPDHCAHLGLMKDVVKVHVNRRWKSPRGRKGKRKLAKAKSKARAAGNVYEVERGDTLSGIARSHGITTAELREANGLVPGGRPIRAGQELIIPKGAKKPGRKGKAKAQKGDKPGRGEKVHVVSKGQALIPIARRYNVTVKAIRERNDLRKGRPIRVGQRLIIPRPSKK